MSIAINDIMRAEIIKTLLTMVQTYYVFPAIAEQITTSIHTRQINGDYDKLSGVEDFADLLTAHMQEVSKDKHLKVFVKNAPESDNDNLDIEDYKLEAQLNNFAFYRVERLPGNIGILDIREFESPLIAGDVAVAAMNFLANTSALIIDLRENLGGSPEMVVLLSTYLFGDMLFADELVNLNNCYSRLTGNTQQFWTLPYVPGKRFGAEKPVYVLTSQRTFSAAEEFCYNLQNLKRATIIGEITGGAANPGRIYPLTELFEMRIPTGRAINPISGTNWEGIGVIPDIRVSAEEALKTAQILALKSVIARYSNSSRNSAVRIVYEAQASLQKLE